MILLGIPNHKLNVKVILPIMLLRNINQTNGLFNGTSQPFWKKCYI